MTTPKDDADRIPVERIVMPSWDQLTHSFAKLGPDDRMKVLIQAGICPKPISGLTWGVELTLLKHNRKKWPGVFEAINVRTRNCAEA